MFSGSRKRENERGRNRGMTLTTLTTLTQDPSRNQVLAVTLFDHHSAGFRVHVPAGLDDDERRWAGCAGQDDRRGWGPGAPRRAAMASSSRALTRACWSAARRS